MDRSMRIDTLVKRYIHRGIGVDFVRRGLSLIFPFDSLIY